MKAVDNGRLCWGFLRLLFLLTELMANVEHQNVSLNATFSNVLEREASHQLVTVATTLNQNTSAEGVYEMNTGVYVTSRTTRKYNPRQASLLSSKNNNSNEIREDAHCHTDIVCVFYKDCCEGYGKAWSKVKALVVILQETKSYLQLVQFYEQYRWYRLSSCRQDVNLVSSCSRDEDVLVKFNHFYNKIKQPSEKASLFYGLSREDIITRCHKTPTTRDPTNFRIPVTLDTGSTKVDFQNLFCAICNGLEPEAVTPWEVKSSLKSSCGFQDSNKNTTTKTVKQNVTKNNKKCRLEMITPIHARICYAVFVTKLSMPESSFRLLFDLKSYFPTREKTCGVNEVYTPFLDKCLLITCPAGRMLVGRACVMEDVCDNTTCDHNTALVMEAFSMTLPTPWNGIEIVVWLEYILSSQDNKSYSNETIKHNSLEKTIDNTIVNIMEAYGDSSEKTYLSLEDMTKLWIQEVVRTAAINKTGMVSKLLEDLKIMTNNMSSVLMSIQQVGTSICSGNVGTALTEDSWSDVCVVIGFNLTSPREIDKMVSVIESDIFPVINNIANQNNFFLTNVTVTNHVNESKPEGGHICPFGGKLVFTKMPIFTNQNGTFLVDFNITALELAKFVFYIKFNGTFHLKEQPIYEATVGWCSQTILQCPHIHVKNSELVVFRDYLLLANNIEEVKRYLQYYTNTNVSLDVLKSDINQRFPGQSISVINNKDYTLTYNGANVCADRFDNKLPKKLVPTTEEEKLATVIALGVSVTCLVIVLVVYGLVPDLRNVPGKIVMSMSSALLVAQTMFLCCTYPQGLACEIYAALHHAVWLASFAWLAAMSLHLACVLHIKSQRWFNPSKPTIFYLFSILCWGLPSLIAGICLLLHKTGTVAIDYGKNGICWIGNYIMAIAVFVSPMFFLLLVTASCAIFVIKAIRQSSDFRQKNSQHKREKTQLILCVNLSLMMGLTWLFYFLAVAVDTTYMWIVFILTNGSQGIYIFMCYVAKTSVTIKLLAVLRKFKSHLPNTAHTDLTGTFTLSTISSTEHNQMSSLENIIRVNA